MLTSEGVQVQEKFQWVCVLGLFIALVEDAHRNTTLEFNLLKEYISRLIKNHNSLRHIRCLFGIHRQFPHIFGWRDRWVFKDTRFERNVIEILICRPRLGRCLGHWDLFCSRIFQKRGSSRESLVKDCREIKGKLSYTWITPRCNHLDARMKCIISQLKPHLIVSFSSTSMRHEITSFAFCNLNLFLCNHWSSKRCSQQINSFVQTICLHRRPNEISHKFLSEIL